MRESFAAGPVRLLSREEIERLEVEGRITPVDRIPAIRQRARVACPEDWYRGSYSYFGGRR